MTARAQYALGFLLLGAGLGGVAFTTGRLAASVERLAAARAAYDPSFSDQCRALKSTARNRFEARVAQWACRWPSPMEMDGIVRSTARHGQR